MQAAINGRLGSQVGVFRARSHVAVGALITALLILFFPSVDNAAGCAEMAAAGRICGVPYIMNYGGVAVRLSVPRRPPVA